MKFQANKIRSEMDGAASLATGSISLQGMPDCELWELFKKERAEPSDSQVFNYIYVKYFPVLIRYGHQFSKDHELVKDVIQDLFIYLKVKRKQLGSTSSIKFYLYKAYRRRISRYLKKYRWNVPPQDIADEGFEITLSQESKMIDSAINDEVKKRLEHAIQALTLRQREIIIYYFFENFSYREITSVMGFSQVQYARISLGRSIAKLRKAFDDQKIISV